MKTGFITAPGIDIPLWWSHHKWTAQNLKCLVIESLKNDLKVVRQAYDHTARKTAVCNFFGLKMIQNQYLSKYIWANYRL